MRIPCKSCDCMMLSINREATRYKCPGCGRVVTVKPMRQGKAQVKHRR